MAYWWILCNQGKTYSDCLLWNTLKTETQELEFRYGMLLSRIVFIHANTSLSLKLKLNDCIDWNLRYNFWLYLLLYSLDFTLRDFYTFLHLKKWLIIGLRTLRTSWKQQCWACWNHWWTEFIKATFSIPEILRKIK